jgi:hypothetical protein
MSLIHHDQRILALILQIQPRFLTDLKDQNNLREQQFAHLECRLEPVADPNLKVDWFKDGKPLSAGKCTGLAT